MMKKRSKTDGGKIHPIRRIIAKELFRFLTDKRMLAALFLPGILIYVVYSLMGSALTGMSEPDTAQIEIVGESHFVNLLEDAMLEDGKTPAFSIKSIDAHTDAVDARIKSGSLQLCIVFPPHFDSEIRSGGASVPEVQIYYNSAEIASGNAYATVTAFLAAYEGEIANAFDVNADSNAKYDLADEKDTTAMIFSMIMPMLLVMLLFTGCMSCAPESISGEKERGTIATLLITPVRRSHLAIGKVVGIAVVSLLGGLSSFLGVTLALPKLVGGVSLSGNVYGIKEYLMILAIILSSIFLFVAVISVISTYAKSVKEASALATPVMLLAVVTGVTGMINGVGEVSLALYLVPMYSSVQALTAIFSFSASLPMILLCAASNLVYTVLLIVLLARMFSSERVMFNR